MNPVNCSAWSMCRVRRGGCCAKNLYGGRPSLAVCRYICTQKDQIDTTQPMLMPIDNRAADLVIKPVRSVPLPLVDFTPLETMTDEELAEKLIQRAKDNIRHDRTLKTELTGEDYLYGLLPALKSLLTEEISAERQRKRLYVCSTCPRLSLIKNKPACGNCGCFVTPDNKSAINLVRREETKQYGCKFYPQSRWKENGC